MAHCIDVKRLPPMLIEQKAVMKELFKKNKRKGCMFNCCICPVELYKCKDCNNSFMRKVRGKSCCGDIWYGDPVCPYCIQKVFWMYIGGADDELSVVIDVDLLYSTNQWTIERNENYDIIGLETFLGTFDRVRVDNTRNNLIFSRRENVEDVEDFNKTNGFMERISVSYQFINCRHSLFPVMERNKIKWEFDEWEVINSFTIDKEKKRKKK